MNNDTQRLFIALNLPREAKEGLSEVLQQFRQQSRGVKWVAPEALHLTLKFLGDVTRGKQEQIVEELNKISGNRQELTFKPGSINAFPGLSRPKVIFLECMETGGNHVFRLQKNISDKMYSLGFEPEKREWKPHITLGRVKSPDNRLPSFDKAKYHHREFSIGTFDLMASLLTRQGPQYSVIKEFNI
jgi:2'-5' RNA ligase